jgi:hypothetical protein
MICSVFRLVKVLQLFVVMSYKHSIYPIINPNSVSSHKYKQYDGHYLLTAAEFTHKRTGINLSWLYNDIGSMSIYKVFSRFSSHISIITGHHNPCQRINTSMSVLSAFFCYLEVIIWTLKEWMQFIHYGVPHISSMFPRSVEPRPPGLKKLRYNPLCDVDEKSGSDMLSEVLIMWIIWRLKDKLQVKNQALKCQKVRVRVKQV